VPLTGWARARRVDRHVHGAEAPGQFGAVLLGAEHHVDRVGRGGAEDLDVRRPDRVRAVVDLVVVDRRDDLHVRLGMAFAQPGGP
jgi:hypothetical protein